MEGVFTLSIIFFVQLIICNRKVNSLLEWLRYFLRSKHRKGFGVHSPFVFYLVTKVIEERYPYYKYDLIEIIRTALFRTKKRLHAKAEDGTMVERNISDMARALSKLPSYDQLLFRLVNHSKPKHLLEMRASFGLSSMYLAAPDSKAQLWTMEEGEVAKYARLSCENAGIKNVRLVEGNPTTTLDAVLKNIGQIDFLFFNPDMTSDLATLNGLFAKCEQKLHEGSVVVVDAIHSTESAKELWAQLKAKEDVRVTIDVYSFGVIYYNTELQKEDYTLRFFPSIKDLFAWNKFSALPFIKRL